jgi:hypothetical protein
MPGIFGIVPAELGKAFGMSFVLGVQIRVSFLAAILISGAVPVARAELLPKIIPNALEAFQAVGLHSSAVALQDSQTGTLASPGAHAAVPTIDSSRATSSPMVVYEHGQLTINAENVRLSDVLTTLHNVMGAEIDLPAGASDERIWARLGPGPARKILSDLLSNTDLNYVIQGSSRDANGIQSVTLTTRIDGGPSKVGVSSESAQRMDNRRQPRVNIAATAATETPDQEIPAPPEPAVAAEVTPPAAAEVTPPAAEAPVEPQPVVASGQGQSLVPEAIAHPGPPATLSQEQIVQQLSNMYQQRKQLQPNQTGSTPN